MFFSDLPAGSHFKTKDGLLCVKCALARPTEMIVSLGGKFPKLEGRFVADIGGSPMFNACSLTTGEMILFSEESEVDKT